MERKVEGLNNEFLVSYAKGYVHNDMFIWMYRKFKPIDSESRIIDIVSRDKQKWEGRKSSSNNIVLRSYF